MQINEHKNTLCSTSCEGMCQSTTFQNSPLKVNTQTANSLNFQSTQQGNWKMPKEKENTKAINTQETFGRQE